MIAPCVSLVGIMYKPLKERIPFFHYNKLNNQTFVCKYVHDAQFIKKVFYITCAHLLSCKPDFLVQILTLYQ